MLITGLLLTCNTIPVCAYKRNPGRDASNRYGPIGKFGSEYEPVSSVTVVRLSPVSVCVMVTSTPGKTAPVWSFTAPLTWAVDCPKTALQVRMHNRIASTTFMPMSLISSATAVVQLALQVPGLQLP